MHIVMFPQERIDLQLEVSKHPELLKILGNLDQPADFTDKLVQIATYCNVAIDGDYNQRELDYICKVCTSILFAKRTSIILPK